MRLPNIIFKQLLSISDFDMLGLSMKYFFLSHIKSNFLSDLQLRFNDLKFHQNSKTGESHYGTLINE